MELVTGVIGSLFTGTSGAASAGGAAAASAGGTASTALSILQGGLSVLGAFTTIASGQAQSDALKQQAFAADMQAEGEKAKGLQRQAQLKRDLARVTGENTVTFAASGIDVSSGMAAADRRAQAQQTNAALSIDRADTDRRRAMLRLRAAGLRSKARAARTSGYLAGAGGLARTGISIMERG